MSNDTPAESSLVVSGPRAHIMNMTGCQIGYDSPGCYGLVLNALDKTCNSCLNFSYIGGSAYSGQIYYDLQSDSMSFNIEGNEIMRIMPTGVILIMVFRFKVLVA